MKMYVFLYYNYYLHFRLNDNVGLITNYEVLKVMQENEESKRRPLIKETDMSTAAQQLHEELKQFDKQVRCFLCRSLICEVIGYLSKSVAGFEDARSIQDCRKALNQYSLTKAETLQILNNAPGSEVEVNLVNTLIPYRANHFKDCRGYC